MLERIIIEKLFGYYDYDIRFNDEKVTIITGPNGYGKTTILRIIKAYANRNFFLFMVLKYDKITLSFSDNTNIEIKKVNELPDHQSQVIIKNLTSGNEELFPDEKWLKDWFRENGRSHYKKTIFQDISDGFESSNDIEQIIQRLRKYYGIRIRVKKDELPPRGMRRLPELSFPSVPLYNAYLIKEQRLHFLGNESRYIDTDEQPALFDTIDAHARDLKNRMVEVSTEYARKAQGLDTSFPQRLFEQQNRITKITYHSAIQEISDKQRQLEEFGLSDTLPKTGEIQFEDENAKVLQTFVEDSRQKLEVFDDILGRLNSFHQILQRLLFPNKKIVFSQKTGFYFTTIDTNEEIPLRLLSSGEQHQIVMWYELLFKAPKQSLILIDEPEISLHVSWQDSFIKNLLEILKIQDINVIVATHSPQIIGPYWHLVHDLYEEQNHAKLEK